MNMWSRLPSVFKSSPFRFYSVVKPGPGSQENAKTIVNRSNNSRPIWSVVSPFITAKQKEVFLVSHWGFQRYVSVVLVGIQNNYGNWNNSPDGSVGNLGLWQVWDNCCRIISVTDWRKSHLSLNHFWTGTTLLNSSLSAASWFFNLPNSYRHFKPKISCLLVIYMLWKPRPGSKAIPVSVLWIWT